MAERGPCNEGMKNEGMKNEGRISKLAGLLQRLEAQQQQPEEGDGMDVRGDWNCHDQEWTPMSPASNSDSSKPTKSTMSMQPRPSSTILAHPLLNARRTSFPHSSSRPSSFRGRGVLKHGRCFPPLLS